MQKRSHKLLASMLLQSEHGFRAKRYELAFLFGSFQPGLQSSDLFEGLPPARKLRGHNFSNSRLYIESHIKLLQARSRWNIWQYYTLGKLTHYLADAFTYPHNEHYPESLIAHRQYEADLRRIWPIIWKTVPCGGPRPGRIWWTLFPNSIRSTCPPSPTCAGTCSSFCGPRSC